MKKITVVLGVFMATTFAKAQGLEGIIVEKFYQANAADSANAADNGADPALRVGAVTYRVYADMKPGYAFITMYGDANHALKVATTTKFYNDPTNGVSYYQGIKLNNLKANTAMIDSYFTIGGVAAGKIGVLKSEDTDGSVGNTQHILANTLGGAFGLPITGANSVDGMMVGSPVVPNVLGFTNEMDVFELTPGSSFETNSGVITALSGVEGITSSNMVLLGQFTTDGKFSFELNLQIKDISIPNNQVGETYVARNPQNGELTIPSLILDPNELPTVTITSPSNNANFVTSTVVDIAANAADSDGTISQVEFFVDNTSVGVDNTVPYTAQYTSTLGSHKIVAVATDNKSAHTASDTINIVVANNQKPTVAITGPETGVIGHNVSITATASDVDGTVSQVEFFVDGTSIGTDATSPFSYDWMATEGDHHVKAVATDNLGLTDTSSVATLSIGSNFAPTVALTSPSNGAHIVTGTVVNVTATAEDSDGTVSQVEFFVDDQSIGVDVTSPYSFDWTALVGSHTIKAVAKDNLDLTKTSTIATVTVGSNQAPTVSITSPANGAVITTSSVSITSSASDIDGTVAQVEFFVDNVSIGVDATSPYSFDWTALAGSHTIKAVAKDDLGLTATSESITITTTVGLEEQSTEIRTVSIYPNPVKDAFTINVVNAGQAVNTHYVIQDITGNIVAFNKLNIGTTNFTKSVDVSTLPSGVYFVRVYMDSAVSTSRIVKQ